MNRSLLTQLLIPTVALVVVLGMAPLASACPSCQQALGEDGAHGDLATGIYYSILFMMSMPFAIIGGFGALCYRAVKREQRRQEQLSREAEEASESSAD